MEEDKLKKDLQDIKDIYLGRESEFVTMLTSEYDKLNEMMLKAVQKQEHCASVTEVDFGQLLKDVYAIDHSFFDKFTIKDRTDDDIKRIKDDYRTLIASGFNSIVYNRTMTAWDKFQAIYFQRKFIVTIKFLYNIEVISGYKELTETMFKHEQHYYKLHQQQIASQPPPPVSEPNDVMTNEKAEHDVPKTVCYFRSKLTHGQEKILVQELREQGYTNSPKQIISFLKGNNKAVIRLNDDKMHHMAYLLFMLCKGKTPLIELIGGKGYFKHFQSAIYQPERKKVNNGMSELKRQIDDKRYTKSHVKSDVQAIIDKVLAK